MPEFVRKKRFYKYTDDKCKKFLSRDFMKMCAYCKIREGDLSGPDDFEKDHFLPQAKGGGDEYDNLYYSCSSCNGKSGKSDYWSSTLLDPCVDDIWDVHIHILENYLCEYLTPRGEEYIKTFKLNRKTYVKRRRIIAKHQMELRKRLEEYRSLCDSTLSNCDDNAELENFFHKGIKEVENILNNGANYRLLEEAFDEDIDKNIYDALSKIGEVSCVDRDYDLFYELSIGDTTYLCHVNFEKMNFEENTVVRRYISIDKLKAWESINKKEKILIIHYNEHDKEIYFSKVDEILNSSNTDNEFRCAYNISKHDHIEKLV